MSAASEEDLEMIDYAIDMLSAELPLIEQEYGWNPAVQEELLGKLQAWRNAVAAGSPTGGPGLVARLDAAGIKEGSLREICGMVDSAGS